MYFCPTVKSHQANKPKEEHVLTYSRSNSEKRRDRAMGLLCQYIIRIYLGYRFTYFSPIHPVRATKRAQEWQNFVTFMAYSPTEIFWYRVSFSHSHFLCLKIFFPCIQDKLFFSARSRNSAYCYRAMLYFSFFIAQSMLCAIKNARSHLNTTPRLQET